MLKNKVLEYKRLRIGRNSHIRCSSIFQSKIEGWWFGLIFLLTAAILISGHKRKNDFSSLCVAHGPLHRVPQTSLTIHTLYHLPLTLFCSAQDLPRCESFLITENKASSSKTKPLNAI